jgi:hypothetical protein
MKLELTISELTLIRRLLTARAVIPQQTICDSDALVVKVTVLPPNSPPLSYADVRSLSNKLQAALNEFSPDFEA